MDCRLRLWREEENKRQSNQQSQAQSLATDTRPATNSPSNHRPVSVGLEAINDNLLNVHGYYYLGVALGLEQEGGHRAQIRCRQAQNFLCSDDTAMRMDSNIYSFSQNQSEGQPPPPMGQRGADIMMMRWGY